MFNNVMLLPSVWRGEYIWSFQADVDEYFHGDTIELGGFPAWRFKRRGRDAVIECTVGLGASLSEGVLAFALDFNPDTVAGPLEGVPLSELLASPTGVGARFYDAEGAPLPAVLAGVDTSQSPSLVEVIRQYRFTEGGYSGWPEAAFRKERQLCLGIGLGFSKHAPFEEASPS